MEFIESIKAVATTITAVLAVLAVVYSIIKWFQKQGQQTIDIEALKKQHEADIDALKKQHEADIKRVEETHKKDIAELRKYHDTDINALRQSETKVFKDIKDELCVLSYAMLAALNGLQQLHCNGDVTDAHDSLEKHLNKKAHGQ